MPMNPRLLRPIASGAVAVALDSNGNVIPSVSYSLNGENYVAHIFNTSGTLRVLRPVGVEYLVVGGGGGGGRDIFSGQRGAGGGGAGGYRSSVVGESSGNNSSAESALALAATTYTVTVGAGGAGGTSSNTIGSNGSNSSFSNITATGGGGGGGHSAATNLQGGSGGSGGGGSNGVAGRAGTAAQGTAGGDGSPGFTAPFNGGGGGGAGQAAANATASPDFASPGGNGLASLITGASVTRAGGGGGRGDNINAAGGSGGGGAGGGVAGTPNTGGGGGANRGGDGGAGGSGVVIVRYKRATPLLLNPDAQDWVNRVYANGGTVSPSTASAVNSFCNDIDAAGIRDRFARLNLFCGSNLNAALVPLYRSTSFGGSVLGNATDTNNAFVGVGTDYAETGASGGLTGNGSSKYLNTGFPTNTLSDGNRHLAAYANTWPNASFRDMIGSESNLGINQQFVLGHQASASSVSFGCFANTSRVAATNVSSGAFWIGDNYSPGNAFVYKNGVLAASGSGLAATPTDSSIFVFALNRASAPTPTDFFNGRLSGYSIGLSVDATQAAAYNTAMQAFQTALGRNV